jgi:hypothetical protein
MKQQKKQEQLLSAIVSSLRRQQLQEITPLIFDPAAIERAEQIPDGERIKIEARILSDAFETVTNGMYNPEALSALKEIDSASPFYGWKELTLSIADFYNGHHADSLKRVQKIPEQSPAASLIPLLRLLCDCGSEGELSGSGKKLYKLITEDRSFFTSAQIQLQDCLEADMEDLFIETALLLIRDLKSGQPEAAGKIALWVIKSASLYAYAPELIVSNIKLIFGEAEGSRLCALALQEEEPEISLLFWIRSFLARLKQKDLVQEEKEAYLDIIARSALQVQRFMASSEDAGKFGYEETEWTTYIQSLTALYSGIIRMMSGSTPVIPADHGHKPLQVFSQLQSLGGLEHQSAAKKVPQAQTVAFREKKSAQPTQLELFG